MRRKSVYIGLLILSLMTFMGASVTLAATFDVDMGKPAPPCGGSVPAKIFHSEGSGFVDCTSNTGGIFVTAMTTIAVGDTVRWTMRSTPHTVTGGSPLTGAPPGVCATGDNFDSGIANADTPGFVFTHTFSIPGTCAYFCIIHPLDMQGQVNIAAVTTLTPVNISTEPSAVQSFTAGYSDPDGWQNISDASLSLSGTSHNELLHYNPQTNKFTLVGASGDCSPGNGATLTNGFLNLNCGASNISGTGNTLTVTYNLTPQPPISGAAYRLILAASDQGGANVNKDMGYWVVNRRPAAPVCTPMNSITPVGIQQTFVCPYSDLDGYQNIADANFYLASGGLHNEWIHYIQAANIFVFMGGGVCTPGQAIIISNGYLSFDCALSSVSGSGTTLTIDWVVTPQAPSSGINYNIFTGVSDQAGAAHGLFAGTWQIP